MTSVLIADDHTMVREGLRRILEATEDLTVCGEAANGYDVLGALQLGLPDVLLLDLTMPGLHGFELIKRIRGTYARLPILVLTMHAEEHYAVRAIQAGASGFLTKEGASTQLVQAIRQVASGRPYVTAAVAEQLASRLMPDAGKSLHEELTNRELQVMELIVAGWTVSRIARKLNLSVKTVSTHKARILGKLQLNSVADLVRYAMAHGVGPDPVAGDAL